MAPKEQSISRPKGLTPERQKLWEALEATSKAFEDVPLEELEGEIAGAIAEDRTERRAKEAHARQRP